MSRRQVSFLKKKNVFPSPPRFSSPGLNYQTSLAYAEMRFILARMLWNFEIEIARESVDWADGLRSWLVWEKRPLQVYLKPRGKG